MSSKKKNKINEQISSMIQGPLKYVVFIDVGSYISRGNGLLTMILRDMGTAKISKLFRPISASDVYKSKEQEFKSLSSRFASNPSLKTLYLALDKLKSSAAGKEDTTQIQKDIQLLVNRIGRTISSKLTDEDKELFDSISPKLDTVARIVGNAIDSSIEPTPVEEPPAEEPPAEETPAEETPAEEKPTEEPAAEEKPTEETPEEDTEEESTTKKEHLENRIKNIVREILKKSVTKR